MATSTSLNLRALLKTAVARSGMDTPAHAVAGLTPPSKALFVAAAANGMPGGTVLFVVPGDADLEVAVADVCFFLAALEGLSEAAADRAVYSFPSHEVDPYRGMAPHFGVTSARARALHALAAGTARVVVASAAALLPRVSNPERLAAASIDLKPGQEISPTTLAELLADAGFTREDPADEHGEFALRGGILDIYPPNEPQPVRLEFIGDTIETMRTYDPATQRSTHPIDQMTIVPLRDVLSNEHERAAATIFDYLARVNATRIVVSEPDEVETNAKKLVEQMAKSYEEGRTDGARLPPPDALFVGWDAVAARLARSTTLSELAIGEITDMAGLTEAAGVTEAGLTEAGLTEARLTEAGLKSRTTSAAAHPPPIAQPPSPIAHPPPTAQRPAPSAQRPAPTAQPPSPSVVRVQPVVEMHGRVGDWAKEIKEHRDAGETTLFVAASAGRAERTIELLKEYDIFALPVERAEDARYAAVLVAVGTLSHGFRLPNAGFHVYAETDVFEEDRRTPERRKAATKAFLSDLRDLKVGDLVVHIDHGIGAFVGLKQIGLGPSTSSGPASDRQEFLELRYAGEDKLFVPVERLDLVQKYTGATRPPLDKLGGASWERAKTRVKKAMRDMAEELLKLYAARKAVPGHAFGPDSHWQREFEDAFEYDLTVDQKTAVADIKRDMESATPMDCLLCGDVGYGKTEVSMRAAFKAVMEGKQVAFLAPTTVLAFQHEKTLKERFQGFPVRIDMVSRFRSKAEQKVTLEELAAGKVDIIVGTHRLLSKDVAFRDLGLLVVDEEQRFGVAHKEKIKQLRRKVDVLTMTATPIPRTLNMSLIGIRDMSIIETPPKDRLSIQTNVLKFDQQVIERAIRNELSRGGQVYFVHNRVESIFSIGSLVQRLVPEARVVVGHGQMNEELLEKAMLDFVAKKFDVLLATTIVENGLDIPNANTIIINRADRYGLSQLYQLRGRVGRSDRPAYAYLLIPPEDNLSPVAKKRLAAIKEFSDLGSGFRVAALDLEIRGAGNLLGGEQSGHIEALGFEMYMKLLEQTVRELKGEEIDDDVRATVNLKIDLKIDESYVPDMNQRLMLYRRVAAARDEQEIERVLEEAADRYGPPPVSVLNLADYGRIRVLADKLGVDSIDRDATSVVLKFRPLAKVDPVRLVALVRGRADLTLVPPAALRLTLAGAGRSAVGGGKAGAGAGAVGGGGRAMGVGGGAMGDGKSGGKGKAARPAPSWWTARARAGEVTPGFTKAEIQRSAKDDPRAEGGIFDQVGAILSELVDRM